MNNGGIAALHLFIGFQALRHGGSAQPLAKKNGRSDQKRNSELANPPEADKNRLPNKKYRRTKVFCLSRVFCRTVYFKKDRAQRFHTSTFDIRYSAVLLFAF
jgi:hypothetical protein